MLLWVNCPSELRRRDSYEPEPGTKKDAGAGVAGIRPAAGRLFGGSDCTGLMYGRTHHGTEEAYYV
jgi:hypothetical protein